MKTRMMAAGTAMALVFGTVAFAQQEGLVNVNVEGVNVQVPISIAAQVCDVDANVLATQYVGTDETVCEIDQETAAEHNIDTDQAEEDADDDADENGDDAG